MITLSLILLTWLPPIANCDGSALDFDHYVLETERVVRTGVRVDPDGSQWDVATRTTLAVPLDSLTLSAQLADPDVGGMVAWRVVAFDAAGNRDCESERPTP